MKQIIASLVVTFSATLVLAAPGRTDLTCKSAAKSGSNQAVEVEVLRSNAVGTYEPQISITLNGKKYAFTTPNIMSNYGNSFHNSPLGVIVVDADNYKVKKAAVSGNLSVVGIPSSVKAYDVDGKLVKWTFKAEQDGCSDSNGKAKFQGVFHGYVSDGPTNIPLDTQILDCELVYDSGSAC